MQLKSRVLSTAFVRGLNDTFLHAQRAALTGLTAAIDAFEHVEMATKLLPNMCMLLIHPDRFEYLCKANFGIGSCGTLRAQQFRLIPSGCTMRQM